LNTLLVTTMVLPATPLLGATRTVITRSGPGPAGNVDVVVLVVVVVVVPAIVVVVVMVVVVVVVPAIVVVVVPAIVVVVVPAIVVVVVPAKVVVVVDPEDGGVLGLILKRFNTAPAPAIAVGVNVFAQGPVV